jgi:hypothetical protein
MKTHLALLSSAALALTACYGDDIGSDGSDVTDESYAFSSDDPRDLEIIDHAGVPLTSTSLVNRDNDYQSSAPNALPYLPSFLKNLRKMHTAFRDNLKKYGLTPCSLDLKLINAVTPCTTQKLWDGGPRVVDVVLPDALEIHLDQPAAWPNGRPIQVCSTTGAWASDEDCAAAGGSLQYVQINDLVLAMGFLKLGADCPGAPGGKCTFDTFVKMKLNTDHNDAELPNTFPFLAPPHS